MLVAFILACAAIPTDDFTRHALTVAGEYTTYGRVDRQFRWSPLDCRMPQPMPPSLRFSKSDDGDTHGQKLYTVFAKKTYWDPITKESGFSRIPTYLPPFVKGAEGKTRETAEVGQVIVKEAWEPVECTEKEYREHPHHQLKHNDARIKIIRNGQGTKQTIADTVYDHSDILIPMVARKNKYFQAGSRTGLFLMMKYEPSTPGTDQGWVYATIASDMKTITSIGKVASCMKCHHEATHDRLYGLPAR